MSNYLSGSTYHLTKITALAITAAFLLGLVALSAWAGPAYAGTEGTDRNLRELAGTQGNSRELAAPFSSFEFLQVPLVPSFAITATKTYTLATDTDGDNQADPGDVLSYTIVISNNGVTTNTGVIFSDTLDPNLSQGGLVSVSPVAFDDSYNASVNPAILIVPDGPTDLFANDYPGLNPAVSGISSFGGGSLGGVVTSNPAGSTVPIPTGGSLTINANGSFDFTPAVGFQGVFTFFYRLQNFVGPADGLVQITIDAPPTVTTTSPVNGATNVNAASNITINFSEIVDIAAGGITLGCPAAVSFTSTPALPASGINSIILDPTTNLPGLATCTVTVLAANTTDSDAHDPPNQLDGNNNGIEGDNYSFTFDVAPTANDDSYNVSPHLTLAATSVRANDDPTTVTITGFGPTLPTANGTVPNGTNSITTGLGGTVILNPDGTFTFNPPPDQRNINDAFFYTITGGDTATVTLTLQNQNLIWFVDASAAAGGNGTQARPFNLLTGAGSFDTVASDNAGDFIFIADGSYTCGLTLLNSQTVVGDGSSATLQAISGVTPVSGSSLPAFSGTDPTLSNAGGDCLTLGSGNTIRGLTIGDTAATGSDITGVNFGTLTVLETTLNGTGRALNLDTGSFNATTTFDGLTSTSGTNNVSLVSVGGTANLGGGALSGASSDAFVVNGGTLSATYSGNITQNNNAALVSVLGGHNTGTLTFQTGTLNATNGTGLQFDNADGTYNFNGTTTLNGGDAGVDILNGSAGTFNFGGTTITNPSGVAFNVDGSAAAVTGGISISGPISKNNAGRLIDFNNYDTGTANISGNLSCASTCDGIEVTNNGAGSGTVNFGGGSKTLNTGADTAVNLDNNDGGTINFINGGLDIDTTSGIGFNATNGAVGINVTTGATPNIIDSTTGTALNVANTAIGASGLTFQSISSNGAANGIVLNNTGSSGGLTVVGNGGTCTSVATCTGGTIQSATVGVFLINTTSVLIDRMFIQNTTDSGVKGTTVTNFSFTNGKIDNSGTGLGAETSNIAFNTTAAGTENNLSGIVTITGNTLTNAFYHGVDVFNFNGTITDANISSNTIISTNSTATSKGSGIRFVAFGSATTIANVTRATIANNIVSNFPSANGIQAQGGNGNAAGPAGVFGIAGSGTDIIAITGNRVAGFSAANRIGTQAIAAVVNGRGQGNFNISNNGTVANPITNVFGTAIAVSSFGFANVTAIVNNNVIVANNAVGAQGIGAGTSQTFAATDTPTLIVTISNNNISQTDGNGILATARDDTGDLNVSIKNNTVAAPLSGNRNGIRVDAGNGISVDDDVCLDISGNTTAGTGLTPEGIGLRKQGTSTTVNAFGIEGMAATNTTGVEMYVDGLNPGSTINPGTGLRTLLISGTSGFSNCSSAP